MRQQQSNNKPAAKKCIQNNKTREMMTSPFINRFFVVLKKNSKILRKFQFVLCLWYVSIGFTYAREHKGILE